MKITRRQLILAVAGIILLGSIGYVGALNGWFGGGSAIPEDTMTRGLIGYWNMDEGGGQTAKDLSGNGNNGTLTNNPQWTKGKIGSALNFDGKDDFVATATDIESLDITDEITIEAWINPSLIAGMKRLIARKSSVYYFQINSNGKLEVYFYGTSSPGYHQMSSTIPLNKWTHIAVTYNGSEVVLYQDDKSESFNDMGSLVSNIENFVIGSEDAFDRFFVGSIDEVRLYNRALSAAEVKYHYNHGGPVAEWKFDEGSGTTIFDSTENNKDGVLHE